MRFRTLEIRWHDSKAISTCDFQPIPVFKKARPPGLGSSDVSQQEWTEKWTSQSYRLATGGDDNHVRVWMVHPNIRPTTAAAATEASTSTTQTAPRPPRIEYLATLSKHSAPVNVVRWSPNGETIASAGDDGMIIIWSPSSTPQASAYGSDVNPDEMSNEKEFWKPRIMVRCTAMEVYDLAWSPTGEYIIAGSTDNAARIIHAVDGKCMHEIADHTHFVQGVSWDPLNEYIATQSSDRAMHVHRVTHNHHGGSLEVHAVGKNSHMNLQTGPHTGRGRARKHARTSSVVSNTSHTESGRESSRPRFSRRESTTSDVESVFEESGTATSSALFSSATPEIPKEKEFKDPMNLPHSSNAPLTPSTSVASTPNILPTASALPPLTVPPITTSLSSGSASSMLPPPSTPIDKEKGHGQPSSRRSSFSNASNAPASPAFSVSSRFGRSPSPMPALPAIRTAIPSSHSYPTPNSRTGTDQWKNIGLYGDESYTNFFRRLTFSPDGALLVTPAGQFEDPEVVVLPTPASEEGSNTPARGRKGRHEEAAAGGSSKGSDSSSCVYIYTRANFAKPPIATLPGHKKASVAVKFNPMLIELREGVTSTQEGSSASRSAALKTALLSNEVSQLDVDVIGPLQSQPSQAETSNAGMGMTLLPSSQRATPTIASPSPRHASAADPAVRPLTPAASKPGTPNPHYLTPAIAPSAPSVFALPYRMLFAVITMDAVVIYDTQQSSPICILTKLHYDEFTDASWSPDGQSLMLSSRDGYCTLVVFDEIFPAYHKQQQALQLQSIAQQHSVPITPVASSSSQHGTSGASRAGTPTATPVFSNVGLPPVGSSSTGFVRSVTPSPTPTVVRARVNAMDRPPTPSAAYTSDADAGGPSVKRGRESEESNNTPDSEKAAVDQPPKKKRRVALTRLGDLGS